MKIDVQNFGFKQTTWLILRRKNMAPENGGKMFTMIINGLESRGIQKECFGKRK